MLIALQPRQRKRHDRRFRHTGVYVLSWCKCRRFRRLEGWRGFWVKFVRFNELFDWARETQNIIFDADKDGLEGLPAGDPRSKFGSTTTNADLRVRKPINCSQVSRSRSAPLASAGLPRLHIWCNAATSGPSAMEHSLTPWPAAWENSTAPEDRKDKVIRAPRELKERSKRERP